MLSGLKMDEKLAILGGEKLIDKSNESLFHSPIITEEDEQAVLDVLHAGTMSNNEIAKEFEKAWADYNGVKYALSYPNGTMALQAAMWAAGLRRGDEIICPGITFWASVLQSLSLGVTPVFADIDPKTLCLDPNDIERHIGPRTRAIMVVHYCAHPCDMDAITAIAHKHDLKIIEDVSHAHGSMYKGRMVGSFGDVAGLSMMARKSFGIGEGGMLITSDRNVYEHALAFSHYERHAEITDPQLLPHTGLPFGGVKGRLNQMCAAMGLVQLKYFPERSQEIERAMLRFWSLISDIPGLTPHRISPEGGNSMGAWYNPLAHYEPEAFGGLPASRFVEAINAEGGHVYHGPNWPLHQHAVMNQTDVYGDGQSTRIAYAQRDVRQATGTLPVCETLAERCIGVPSFKRDNPDEIARYAEVFRKVASQVHQLD